MENFSFTTFMIGFFLTIASALFIGFHRKLADAVGGGLSDYERYKKWGLVALGISILVMINVHKIILGLFINTFFKFGR